MGEGAHVFNLRVYYEDTDSEGIVYYANYLKFAERGRTELLRAAGIEHSVFWRTHGIGFAVRRVTADYLAPARLDDALAVHTRMISIRGASLIAEQTIRRGTEDLARLLVRIACVNRDGRVARLPQSLRTALNTFQSDV
jgi:acyl-CoA thioester hydrolase